jgi:hypothetical protein
LLNTRQRQPDFPAIIDGIPRLQRITLKIDRLETFLVCQFLLHFLERRQLVVAGPELLELGEGAEVAEVLELVVGYVEDGQVGVGFQARERCQGVV